MFVATHKTTILVLGALGNCSLIFPQRIDRKTPTIAQRRHPQSTMATTIDIYSDYVCRSGHNGKSIRGFIIGVG